MNLVILDRDGVINEDSDNFIKNPDEWHAIPGSVDAIARLNRAGYRVVVATNQSGLARGLFDLDDLHAIHRKMSHTLEEAGAVLDGIYFCPHGPDDDCQCRKPRPGLFHEIASRTRGNLNGVLAIGDSLRDLQAAASAGAMPVLVRTGKGAKAEAELTPQSGVPTFDNLAQVVETILLGVQDGEPDS